MENLFDVLNTIAQFLMVFASFLTIIITMHQIKNNNKENILLNLYVSTGAHGSSGKIILTANIEIEISNMSNKIVYINQYGVLLKNGKHNPEYNFCLKNIVINPGEQIKIVNENILELFSTKMKDWKDDKVFVYVITGRGKKFVKDTGFTYFDVANSIEEGLDYNRLIKNEL